MSSLEGGDPYHRGHDRGLVGWNRQENNYDLHPIVRGVVWSGLGADARRGVFGSLHSYFQAIPVNENNEPHASLDEAKSDIELFNALVGLQKYGEASKFYFDRIHPRANFETLGVTYLKAAMLNSLFPEGYDNPPKGLDFAIYAQLAHCCHADLKFHECFDFWLRAMRERKSNSEQSYCYLSGWCLAVGLLGRSCKIDFFRKQYCRCDQQVFWIYDRALYRCRRPLDCRAVCKKTRKRA